MTIDQSLPDFTGTGSAGLKPLHWVWNVDGERLKDVNRASGMDGTTSHLRGFLCRLVTTWMDTPPARRPALAVPETLPEDLVYIPSPCYIFALSEDRSVLQCWYSVLVDASCEELLEGKAGVRMFTLEGEPEFVTAYLDGVIRLFRFRSKSQAAGYSFFRRF